VVRPHGNVVQKAEIAISEGRFAAAALTVRGLGKRQEELRCRGRARPRDRRGARLAQCFSWAWLIAY